MSQNFRKTFQHLLKDVAHYFPGHMARGLRRMQQRLKDVDLILEVHDARMPLSGRNQYFRDTLLLRPHLLLLNKIDLADCSQRPLVDKMIKDQGVTDVLYINCRNQGNTSIKTKVTPKVLQILKNSPRYHREEVDHYNMLVIGIPNVGKSSLINAWRSAHLKRGKATVAGAMAGVTTSVLEKIRVHDKPKIYLYDTPGIMPYSISDMETGMKLALCSTIRDHLIGEDKIVDYLLFWLNKHEHFSYTMRYHLPKPIDDVYDFLAHIAKQGEFIIKKRNPAGGYMYMPDFMRAARLVLSDFRTGQLGKFNLDQDQLLKAQGQQKYASEVT